MNSKTRLSIHRLESYLQRRQVPQATKLARWLLTDTGSSDDDGHPTLRLTKTNPMLQGILAGDTTSTSLRDILVTSGMIYSRPLGQGPLSWVFRITPELQKYREELAKESSAVLPLSAMEKRLQTKLDHMLTRLETIQMETTDRILSAIDRVNETDPPATAEKVQRHLTLVKDN